IWKNSDGNGGNGIRYCTYSDYYISETDITIKQYGLDTGKSLLYFDWYDTTEYYFNQEYKLNDTDEIICLEENIVDENGALIYLYLTDYHTDIDFIKIDTDNCTNILSINSIDVKWRITSETGYACFSYDKHNYYLKIEGVEDKEYIENLVSTLLS
ncbi:MAG: hypothetical protein K2I67_00010, partial [Malacoplasma sp.]|nr:hypothetical protein [Malacoplasma sp.]